MSSWCAPVGGVSTTALDRLLLPVWLPTGTKLAERLTVLAMSPSLLLLGIDGCDRLDQRSQREAERAQLVHHLAEGVDDIRGRCQLRFNRRQTRLDCLNL